MHTARQYGTGKDKCAICRTDTWRDVNPAIADDLGIQPYRNKVKAWISRLCGFSCTASERLAFVVKDRPGRRASFSQRSNPYVKTLPETGSIFADHVSPDEFEDGHLVDRSIKKLWSVRKLQAISWAANVINSANKALYCLGSWATITLPSCTTLGTNVCHARLLSPEIFTKSTLY